MPSGAAPRPVPETEPRVVRVVADVAAVRKPFDYRVPPELDGDVRVGTSVRVVLHNRRVAGWVVAEDGEPPPGVALRDILAVRGWGPPPSVVDLAAWAAWRWAGPWPRLLATASAPTLVRALPAAGRGARAPGENGAGLDGVTADALAGGTSVVRLAPATDPYPVVAAAAARLTGTRAADGAGRAGAADGGAGVLVLAPSQSWAARLAGRLRAHGFDVALLPEEWARARAGGRVVVGSRAGAWAPLPRLAAAVVLDAHDEAYVEERAPTWAAWRVVAERGRRDGAPVALVSPCPTLELLAAGRLVTAARAEERAGWPQVQVVDRRADDPRRGLYSEPLVQLVRWAAEDEGRRVLCVLNRTGRIRLLACATCGALARCARCGAAVESRPAEEGTAVLHCRQCSDERPVVCAACGATRLKALRVGVSRVREELEALAGTPVEEVTADSGPPAPARRVIVGTEAVLHRVGRADAVCFLDMDAELLAPRYGAGEQALALLARAGRVVSRAATGAPGRSAGTVLVQTRQPDHPALRAALLADPGVLAEAEAPVRQALGLPPARAMAAVSGPAADVYGVALRDAATPGVEVHGPVDGVWSLRAPDHRALCDLLAAVERPPGRLRVEVDPRRA
ncbi:MAG TPA: hypothetical protein VE991_05610 [Acidimicrobiales bacterium]|nr:hypothetical protein [Acidimicrobiales bacterium]